MAFIVVIPEPCIDPARRDVMIETMERMTGRIGVAEPVHRAEAISFVLWDPVKGNINPSVPDPASPLRIDRLSDQIEAAYHSRYKGDPPHR